jgi:hypothetical protein
MEQLNTIGNIVATSPLDKYRGRHRNKSPDKKTKQTLEHVSTGESECACERK